jgi:MerR family transcriptional regulator, copper efflux regulator
MAGSVKVPVYGKVKVMLQIGELAERTGVPAKTIRYYEQIGVLAPPDRTPAGYRIYDQRAIERLAFVRSAQGLGLTLGEIRGIVAMRERGEAPCDHVLALMKTRAAEVHQRVVELQRLGDELDRLADRARTLDPSECDSARICHLVGPHERPAATM